MFSSNEVSLQTVGRIPNRRRMAVTFFIQRIHFCRLHAGKEIDRLDYSATHPNFHVIRVGAGNDDRVLHHPALRFRSNLLFGMIGAAD